jgi:hypothetical protein
MRALIVAFSAVAVLATATACGDDADSNSSAQQSDVETIKATIQDNEVLFTIKAVGDLPLHDMDEAINAGTVEDNFLPTARDAVRYLGLTNWPSSLENDAQAVEDAAIALAAALDEGDTEAAKQPATDLHELWHEFEDHAWAEIGEDLPPEAGIGAAHDAGGSETPGAEGTEESHDEETPVAGETPTEGEESH